MPGVRTIGRAAAHSASANATAIGTRSGARSGASAATEGFDFDFSRLGSEAPLSMGGLWVNTGLDWTLVNVDNGVAHGTQTGVATPPYKDSYAMFTGDVGNDYRVECHVFIDPGIITRFLEVEILLRWSQSAHFATGYELTLSKDGEYDGGGQWPADGSLGTSFTQYRNLHPAQPSSSVGLTNGDIYYGQIIGNVVSCGLIRGGTDHPMYSWTDTDPAALETGQPGIGFFRDDNTGGAPSGPTSDSNRFGFTRVRIIRL